MRVLVVYQYFDVEKNSVVTELLPLKEWAQKVSSRNNSVLYDIENIFNVKLKEDENLRKLRNKILDCSAVVCNLPENLVVTDD